MTNTNFIGEGETLELDGEGWGFWAGAADLGGGLFWKGEYVCSVSPGDLPGAVGSMVRPVDRREMFAAQDAAAAGYTEYPDSVWRREFQEDWVRAQFA